MTPHLLNKRPIDSYKPIQRSSYDNNDRSIIPPDRDMRLHTPHNHASSVSKLSPDLLASLLPNEPDWPDICHSVQGEHITTLLNADDILKAEGITTEVRLAHFLGQCLIESNFFRATEENLNYSPRGLRTTWPARFPSDSIARNYARQPERIANYVYADRMENGDEASGDGWRFRGRGIIQLTGRRNYRRYADLTGLPLEKHPDSLANDMNISVLVAAKFFTQNNLIPLADANDAKRLSRAINRGNPNSVYPAHREADRIQLSKRALSLLSAPIFDQRSG
ncbi:glycoside hydrolase family 19 protein [Ponticaulis koreensis]|uniref:glycoside hydrolase family 19 protein n=1 Tax=Ponticaulis koreensis TaxID=1123045 RepID=UPI00138AC4DB|nr:glycoside hydrolase family 19 protein [Ponticaulis koreensis]